VNDVYQMHGEQNEDTYGKKHGKTDSQNAKSDNTHGLPCKTQYGKYDWDGTKRKAEKVRKAAAKPRPDAQSTATSRRVLLAY